MTVILEAQNPYLCALGARFELDDDHILEAWNVSYFNLVHSESPKNESDFASVNSPRHLFGGYLLRAGGGEWLP